MVIAVVGEVRMIFGYRFLNESFPAEVHGSPSRATIALQ
jgi:hypothetical protein